MDIHNYEHSWHERTKLQIGGYKIHKTNLKDSIYDPLGL